MVGQLVTNITSEKMRGFLPEVRGLTIKNGVVKIAPNVGTIVVGLRPRVTRKMTIAGKNWTSGSFSGPLLRLLNFKIFSVL